MAMKIISITDIGDFRIGNAESSQKGTGCTVIVSEEGAVGGVDVRGGGPATRETDLLRSENTVNSVNAVVLSGGSAFGLEAASGVMRELADRRIGFDVGDDIVVPIVCGASLYDLPIGDPKAFPDVNMGAQAVRNAFDGAFAKGNHGAGTGATVGKMKGYGRAMKSGLGTFACGDGVIEIGAIAAVNAVGDIYNGAGNIVAGLRSEDGKSIYGTIKTLKSMVHDKIRLVDDSTTFISKSDIEDALAAAAKQYEKEKAAEAAAEPIEESAVEVAKDEIIIPVISAEIEVPDHDEDASVMSQPMTDPEESFAEESVEEAAEEPAEVVAETAVDEIIQKPLDVAEDALVKDASDEDTPEVLEFPSEDLQYNGSKEFAFEEQADEFEEESPENTFDEHPEEEAVETETEAEPEPVEIEEASAEEEVIEEPIVLTREDMGYDITFNTTISCLITNAALTKSQANKLASILHDAYARAIKPVHGTLDGDTVFVLASGKQQVNFDAFAALATDIMQYAVIDGAMLAESAYGLPAARDMQKTGE